MIAVAALTGLIVGILVGVLGWRWWSRRHLRRFSRFMKMTGPTFLTDPDTLVRESKQMASTYHKLLREKTPQ